MAGTHSFPSDLLAAQRELHEVTARLRQVLAELPWSVEPLPGWSSDPERDRGYRSERPDSPGWTSAQQQTVADLRERAVELSIAVATHPYWSTKSPDGSEDRSWVVAARMALKHAHEQAGEQETAA
ncbi:hypothetical protein AB0K09_20350 [Streptomyces sp. NPDC049577]|uniref:hypothetical protein n=1 Tax=Streptomyces sp. NPDC049577 TaxID=3155153 RepID=UPI003439A0BD